MDNSILWYFVAPIAIVNILLIVPKIIRIILMKSYHKQATTTKQIVDTKFNEAKAVNLSRHLIDELEPIVNLDVKGLKTIVFVNNINNFFLGQLSNRVFIDLKLPSYNGSSYYMTTNNYDIDESTKLVGDLITRGFPKSYNNNELYHDVLNLRDLGCPSDIVIKLDMISAITFIGRSREFVILTNNAKFPIFYVNYKNKAEMINNIKKTPLYKHIMQWGVPGFKDSTLAYSGTQDGAVELTEDGLEDD